MKNRKDVILQILKNVENSSYKPKIHVDNGSQSWFYRGLCFSYDHAEDYAEIYDTSTDVYRPLRISELIELEKSSLWAFTTKLLIKNTKESIRLNRRKFHIAIAKNNQKEKNYFHKKAIRKLKKLSYFFLINKK